MEEPNLLLIKEISGNDVDFQNNILEIIKKEFITEESLFHKNFTEKNYLEAANVAHKMKHKISLLGLKKGTEVTAHFEKELRSGKHELYADFFEILNKIHVYLYD